MDKCPHCQSPIDHHDAVADYTIFTCGSYCPPNYADEVVTTGLCETRKELQSVRAERDRLRRAIESAPDAWEHYDDSETLCVSERWAVCEADRRSLRSNTSIRRVKLVPLSVLEESC